jgi:hypothetical protein
VSAIRKIAQLATVEAQISDVLRFEEVKSFLIFDFPKTATIRMRGRVIAGFDLAAPEFRVEPDGASRRIRVTLPAPRILAIDPRLEWFDETSGIFNPITPQDRTRWMLWAAASSPAPRRTRASRRARSNRRGRCCPGRRRRLAGESRSPRAGRRADPPPTP